MLYMGDHTFHSIISRQIDTLVEAGYSITVLDGSNANTPPIPAGYTKLVIPPVRLGLFRTGVWKFARPLLRGRLAELYWTALVCAELALTSVRYAAVAFRCDSHVYQAHDLWALLSAVFAGKLRRRPIVYDAHELASEQGDTSSLYNSFLRLLERCLIPQSDRLIMPNTSRAQLYKQKYPLKSDPLVVFNCTPRLELAKTSLLRETLRLPSSTRIVLYHGAFMPGRALEELIRSAHYFEEGTVLVLIGEQNEYFHQVLQPLWQSENLDDNVFFLPWIPQKELMLYVASSDLGVVIYRNINLNNYLCAPTKLYEYIMAGVPVVASDFPELQHLFTEYPIGLMFNPDDPQSIAGAINDFFRTESERRVQIEHYLGLARLRFNWELESQKLTSLFQSLSQIHGAVVDHS